MITALFIAVLIAAAGYAFVNGFHDVSNTVAPAVRTRALSPRAAVILAAVFNAIGVLSATGIVTVFLFSLGDFPSGSTALGMLLTSSVAAIGWGLITWWWGIPSSSTQALIGGLVGALFAHSLVGETRHFDYVGSLWLTIILPLFLSPVLAFVLGFLAVIPVLYLVRHSSPSRTNSRSRSTQAVLSAAFALGHGMQDGQRTVLILALALGAVGLASPGTIPLWTQIFAAGFLALGTLLGGWKISYTLGYRLVRTDPPRAMSAQAVSTGMLLAGALVFHLPISSTHTLASALVGTGMTQRFSGIRAKLLVRMVTVWLITAPVAALISGVLYLALSPLLS